MLEDISVEIEPMTDEEFAEMHLEILNDLLESPRATHAISEGYPETPLW